MKPGGLLVDKDGGVAADHIDFDRRPDGYKHWSVSFDGAAATLTIAVDPNSTIGDGYELKLNTYDLGVDPELYDIVQRLRFEHPEVGAVVVTSGLDKVFSGPVTSTGVTVRATTTSSVTPHLGKP